MPKVCYDNTIKFTDAQQEMIDRAIQVVRAFQDGGYGSPTLRQVYYQFIANDWFPSSYADPVTGSTNNMRSYKKLGELLNRARVAGVMDWTAMVDSTREMGGNVHFDDPTHAVRSVADCYMIDKWQDQQSRPVVYVEKDAVEGVIKPVCNRLDIPYFSCPGYTSQTAMWENAQRLKAHAERELVPVILHHDPSGIDMSRDIEERIRLYMDEYGDWLVFKRLALNRKQVDAYRPPENPAKSTDSRYKAYVKAHGQHSWELDALKPEVLDELITRVVVALRDKPDAYQRRVDEEAEAKELLTRAGGQWADVAKFLRDNGSGKRGKKN